MSEFYEVFNHRRYQKDGIQLQSAGDDALANAGMVIQFVHIPTGNIINFKAFIESFTETYKSSWSTETVLGRMDPIYLFGSTDRTISLAFKVPAASDGEAYENLGKTQSLIQFLSPTLLLTTIWIQTTELLKNIIQVLEHFRRSFQS